MKRNIKIDSHERFLQEYENLLDEINDNIRSLAQYEKVEMDSPSVSIAEKLNRLKYHRKLLQSMLESHREASDEEWATVREKAQKVYDEARKELLRASEELTNS